MKVLVVHNKYKIRGGEDTVVANEIELLLENGVDVATYIRDNLEIDDYSFTDKLSMLKNTTFSKKSYNECYAILKSESPDICHVHNTFPLISPAVYQACQDLNIPVVQTLHNYRLGCLNGMLLKKQQPCEVCISRGNFYQGIKNRCYRNSYLQSYTVARMLTKHRKLNTWNSQVGKYLCLTEFAKEKMVESGIERNLLESKPNFVRVHEQAKQLKKKSRPQILFIGRLEAAKGINSFLELAKLNPSIDFVAAGKNVDNLTFHQDNLRYLGEVSNVEAQKLIGESTVLIFPSTWYEGMPMTIIESFALKTPVIASNLGAMKAMISVGENGLLFNPNYIEELSEKLNELLQNKELYKTISSGAYQDYTQLYSPKANFDQLISIYQKLIK